MVLPKILYYNIFFPFITSCLHLCNTNSKHIIAGCNSMHAVIEFDSSADYRFLFSINNDFPMKIVAGENDPPIQRKKNCKNAFITY